MKTQLQSAHDIIYGRKLSIALNFFKKIEFKQNNGTELKQKKLSNDTKFHMITSITLLALKKIIYTLCHLSHFALPTVILT